MAHSAAYPVVTWQENRPGDLGRELGGLLGGGSHVAPLVDGGAVVVRLAPYSHEARSRSKRDGSTPSFRPMASMARPALAATIAQGPGPSLNAAKEVDLARAAGQSRNALDENGVRSDLPRGTKELGGPVSRVSRGKALSA